MIHRIPEQWGVCLTTGFVLPSLNCVHYGVLIGNYTNSGWASGISKLAWI
jgi:hypothetical protein